MWLNTFSYDLFICVSFSSTCTGYSFVFSRIHCLPFSTLTPKGLLALLGFPHPLPSDEFQLMGVGKSKRGHSGLTSSRLCVHQGGFGEKLYSNGSNSELLARVRVCAGLLLFNLDSGGLLMSFCGSQAYQTVTFSLK